jgi:hypothetical protein
MYTGIFRAKVLASRYLKEEGYIELQVKEGVIHSCLFITRKGQTYKWDHWEKQIVQLGVLNWELTTQQSSQPISQAVSSTSRPSSQEQASAAPQTPYSLKTPYHTAILSALQLRQWPMLHRQVYSLIDGRRQLSDIALVLHKSQQEIVQIIDDLRQQGLIDLR